MKSLTHILFGLTLLITSIDTAHAVIGGAPDLDLEHHTVMVLSTKGSLCSGVLIAPRHVLTAAHCVSDHSDYAVHIRDDAGNPLLLRPSKIIIHPDYVPDAIAKRVRSIDLALIILNESLPTRFTPVALSDAMPRQGDRITVGGYGLTDEKQKNKNGTFNATDLTVIEPYGPSRILLWLKADSQHAGTGGCHGDSGGPLFDHGALVGITTWTTGLSGRECGDLTQGVLIAPQRAFIETGLQ